MKAFHVLTACCLLALPLAACNGGTEVAPQEGAETAASGRDFGGRDQIRIVGSSTVYPFATKVAEQFGRRTQNPTPIIESTGSGGGFKLFCAGIGTDHPDVTNSSRAIKDSEIRTCADNGVEEITEVEIGYDGIVIANQQGGPRYSLTRQQLFQALAKELPNEAGELVPNPNRTWADVDPSLPDVYTLGECVTESYPSDFGGPETTRSVVVLYYGSFFRVSRQDDAFDWEVELWETLTHELQHHLESLAADDSLIDMDYAADENYRRESLLDPQAKIVAGFQPIMPTFQGLVSEEQLLQLIAYIRSLSAQGAAPSPAGPLPMTKTSNCSITIPTSFEHDLNASGEHHPRLVVGSQQPCPAWQAEPPDYSRVDGAICEFPNRYRHV